MSDSESWYLLGNAHLTNFFVNNESTKELESALRAYSLSEKYLKDPNPDLFFNRGTVLEYLERYTEAAHNFQVAHSIDASLQGAERANQILSFVSKACQSIKSKARIKSKQLATLASSIPRDLSPLPEGFRVADSTELTQGHNPQLILSAKVIHSLDKPAEVPVSFLVMDSSQNFFVVSIYHVSKQLSQTIKLRSDLLIKCPYVADVELSFKGYSYSYPCIKVTDLSTLLVNGQVL